MRTVATGASFGEGRSAKPVEKERRKANIRLAIILGLIAFGFYLLMILFNPL